MEVSRLVGFCLLIKRAVIDKIGGMDEAYTSGMFTDDDFCLRALVVGFKARVALDSFVHHDMSATFREGNADFAVAMRQGWEAFERKWGAVVTPTGYRVNVPAWDWERCYVAVPGVPNAV